MRFLLSILGFSALVPLVQSQVRVMALHELPTEKQQSVLDCSDDQLDSLAKTEKILVIKDGLDTLLYPENLYNLTVVDEVILGCFALANSPPTRLSQLKDFDANGRKGIRRLFDRSHFRSTFGNLLDSDDLIVEKATSYKVVLESGGKKISCYLHGMAKYPDKEFDGKVQTTDFAKNKEDYKLSNEKLPDVHQLMFFFRRDRTVPSHVKTNATTKLLKVIHERLEAQQKAYELAHTALDGAYSSGKGPKPGDKWTGLDPQLKDSGLGEIRSRYADYGFSSREAAIRFIENSTIVSSKTVVMVGTKAIGNDGTIRGGWTHTEMNRGF